MASTILVIEDDPLAADLVRRYLTRDGHEVLVEGDGIQGLRTAREHQPDLIVLDLMLPGLDGMEVCRTLRKESSVPIVMLTARAEEEDRLAGLDVGADDYVVKPFSPRELAARVRAVLRRTARDRVDEPQSELVCGDLRADMRQRTVHIGGVRVDLTPTEWRLLAMFLREPGRTFSRDQIMDRVFGYDFDGFDRAVDAHISNLRRKLEQTPNRRRYIHTVYGAGYKFGDG